MSILIIILFCLVVWHFFYDGIIAPSLRQYMRFRLFKERDRLRDRKWSHPDEISDELFYVLNEAFNSQIGSLREFTLLSLFFLKKEVVENESINKELQKRVKLLNEADEIPFVRKFRDELASNMAMVVLVNSGGWIPYLIPLLAFAICYKRLCFVFDSLYLIPSKFMPSDDRIVVV